MEKKINEFKKALNAVEGLVGMTEVEDRGRKHLVLATKQDVATINGYDAPSRKAIEMFAEHFGLKVAVLPFADPQGRGVCYDVVLRPMRVAA